LGSIEHIISYPNNTLHWKQLLSCRQPCYFQTAKPSASPSFPLGQASKKHPASVAAMPALPTPASPFSVSTTVYLFAANRDSLPRPIPKK
jgi:hypothetical protein